MLRSFQPCFLSVNLKNPGIRYRFFFIFIYKYTRIYLYKYKSTASSCFSSECTVIKARDGVSWAPQKQTLQEGQEAGHRRRPGAGSSLWEGSCTTLPGPSAAHGASSGPPPGGGPSPSLRGNPSLPPKHLHASSLGQRSPPRCRGWLYLLVSSLLAKTRYPCVP